MSQLKRWNISLNDGEGGWDPVGEIRVADDQNFITNAEVDLIHTIPDLTNTLTNIEDDTSLSIVIGKIVHWLTQRHIDQRGDSLLNGARRSLQYRQYDGVPYISYIDPNDGDKGQETNATGYFNSTSAGITLEFLSRACLRFPNLTVSCMPIIEEIANFLLASQHKELNTARYGGFALAVNDQTASSFNAGVVGKGLLYAWKLTNNPSYIEACYKAASFLSVCADPNSIYEILYSETPIPNVAGNNGFMGFCDAIGTTDIIYITSSTWNLVAVEFLHELSTELNIEGFAPIIEGISNFMSYGVTNGYDYFAIENSAPGAKVSTSWPNISAHEFADGAWHRAGNYTDYDEDPPKVYENGTVGTDSIEYGLASLFTVGFDSETLLYAYEYFRGLEHVDFGENSFGTGYNGAICFTGHFRLDAGIYNGESKAYGTYYDVQGAGTLLKFKKILAPADYILARQLALLAVDRGALVIEDFTTKWSPGNGFNYYTKGAIPIAKAGIGLLLSEGEV
jgi:hypothetical protein